MKNMLGRSENASNVVANNEENALNRIKPATWREGDMQLGKGSSSMLAERYQREKTPVDVKRNYSELKVSKICSDASSSDMKGAKKKESEINVLISKVMQDAKKRVPVSREVNIQGTSPEIPEGSLKKRTVSPSIIAMDLLYSYNFGVAGNQLYIYEEKYGYWKMIQASAENRDLRALIKENDKAYVNKSALSEIYEWIRIDAEVLDTGEQGKYYLNFRDCAVN